MACWSIEQEHRRLALDTVAAHALRTPLVPAPRLGARVWVKLENRQHTHSFKVRGALTRLAALTDEERSRGVVAASAGNHGLGVAYAARALGISARVFVPSGIADVKRNGMLELGAHVEVTAAEGYDDTEALARADAEQRAAVFVSPYDDPFVAAGNGYTVGREVLVGVPHVSAVVLPVGGGGLLAGVAAARGLHGRGVSLIGVQSEASPAMVESLRAGHAIEHFEGKTTLAEGLEGGVSATTFELARTALDRMELVSEGDIAGAMRAAWELMGERLEGSGAVAIAWAMAHAAGLGGDGPVVVLATGGNVDGATFRRAVTGSG